MNDYRYYRAFRFFNNQNPQGNNQNLKPIAHVKYEYFFNIDQGFQNKNFQQLIQGYMQHTENDYSINLGSYNINAPFFNWFNQRLFVQTILDNAFSGKVKVIEFGGNRVLTPDEAHSKVFEPLIVQVMNFDTGLYEDRAITNDYTSEIISVIFTEDWYFDEDSMRFIKKVVGIAPVRYYVDSNNEQNTLKRKVLFTLEL